MAATCCSVEPLHGSAWATITVKIRTNPATVTIQLSMLAGILPVRPRTLPALMLNQTLSYQQLVGPASSQRGSKTSSSRPGAAAILQRGEERCGRASWALRSGDNLPVDVPWVDIARHN